MNIPENQQAVMPYLILQNARGFKKFTEDVFGAKEMAMHLREDGETIMHAQVMIGGCTIMFAEASDEYPATAAGLFIYADDADKSYEKALAAGAFSVMPPADQPYGRSCGIKDAFGITWWITSI